MTSPVTYSPSLGALIDSDGHRLAACESDAIGHALAASVNAVLMVTLTRTPFDLVARLALVDPQAALQLAQASGHLQSL